MTLINSIWRKTKDCAFEVLHGFRGAPIEVGDLTFRVPVELRRLKTAEDALVRELKARLKPGQTFVDVGANVGLVSLVAASCSAPDGRICASEPLSENVAFLRRAIRLNGLERRVAIVESAVSADAGSEELTFFAGPPDSGAQPESSLRPSGAMSREVKVANTTLDKFFAGKPAVHLIEIDTEGAEWGVIAGAQELIARDRPVLIIEYHGGKCADFGYSPAGLQAEVARLGYDETVISGDVGLGYFQTVAVPR